APVFSLSSAAVVRRTASVLARAVPGRPSLAAALVCMVALAPGLIRHRDFFLAGSPQQRSQMLYNESPFGVSAEIAARVVGRAAPSDRVLIFGSEPQILFYAQRRSATRYIIFYPLMLGDAGSLERQKRTWEEIEHTRPRYILMTEITASLLPQSNAHPSPML